jgi:hypothetical protein
LASLPKREHTPEAGHFCPASFLSLGQRENWLPILAKQTTLTSKELKAEGK